MTERTQAKRPRQRLMVLGATGKLARMVRHCWAVDDATESGVTWVSRRPGDGVTTWTTAAPARGLPRADVVIALWGVTGGSAEALARNAVLARAAMDLADTVGADRVLHCSSAAVYGGGAQTWSEDDPTAPRAPYGAAKVAMEAAVADWTASHPGGPAACCLRLANVAGADQLFAAIGRDEPLTLDRFPDRSGPARSYVAPSDLARVLADLAALPLDRLPAVLNIAGPQPVSMADIAEAAGKAMSWRPAPETALPVMRISDARLAALVGPLARSASARDLAAEGLAGMAVPS
ncbi:NAD-dependent epimerase/dehydratase family protein [Pseudooceanicola sp. LIPI14-2-Ac024]|uniref:NAD-dependent epimerase/dehydratase family protein n=1 Tax=Pseudooceanicola sp. LIPI14-2-Ac024 TaxID=3344875 RepID=UPI0035CEB6F6